MLYDTKGNFSWLFYRHLKEDLSAVFFIFHSLCGLFTWQIFYQNKKNAINLKDTTNTNACLLIASILCSTNYTRAHGK